MKTQTKKGLGLTMVAVTALAILPIHNTVYGEEQTDIGTASDDVENMIRVGTSLIGETPYVFGGGHSDWEEQKSLDIPTGLDNSSFVSWVLYRGLGIDIGFAPIAGQFTEYFDTITVGSLDGVQRGDLIADDKQVEIYLGKDNGKHYSLLATNDKDNVTITETNWGRGVKTKSIMRPNVLDAVEGKNGLTYNGDAIIDTWGDREIGSGNDITFIDGVRDTSGYKPSEEQVERSKAIKAEGDKKREEELESKLEEQLEEELEKGKEENELFAWLNPMVDFKGASNTHSKSESGSKKVDGNTKGLKGHKQGLISIFF